MHQLFIIYSRHMKKSHSEEMQFYLNWSLGMTDSIYLFSKMRETKEHSILTVRMNGLIQLDDIKQKAFVPLFQ